MTDKKLYALTDTQSNFIVMTILYVSAKLIGPDALDEVIAALRNPIADIDESTVCGDCGSALIIGQKGQHVLCSNPSCPTRTKYR